jgi:hypothetical protein
MTEHETTDTERNEAELCPARTVSIVKIVIPDSASVNLTATVTTKRVENAQTATLDISFANDGSDQITVPFRADDTSAWWSEDNELVLLPTANDHRQTDAGCWSAGTDERPITGSGGAPRTTLDLGESLTIEYEVWDYARTSGYFEPGRYTFASEIAGQSYAVVLRVH